MYTISVVNKYKMGNVVPGVVVYVGRGSPLGNPYPMEDKTDYERNRVCNLYEYWLNANITTNNPEITAELARIAELSRNNDIYLQCYCAPKRCHADYLKTIIERIRKESHESRRSTEEGFQSTH
jgi:hypothetical protein